MKSNTKTFFLFVVLIFIDQISKYLSSNFVCNKNIAWSIPIAPAIFCFVWIAVVGFLVYLFFKTKSYHQKIFLILVLSGAISNVIDRLRFGCVIDYIDLKFWPVFNLADVYITIGIALIILNVMRNKNTKY